VVIVNGGRRLKKFIGAAALIAAAALIQGCVLLAAAGAGVMAHDEATENDGEFDPLEKVEDALDDGDGK